MTGAGDDREYCRLCRTFSAPGDRCGNCHRRRDGAGDELEAAVAQSLAESRVVHRHSRLRAGTTTFGPVGRIALSAVPVVGALLTIQLAYRFRDGPAVALFGVAAVATTFTALNFLRVVWRKDRID